MFSIYRDNWKEQIVKWNEMVSGKICLNIEVYSSMIFTKDEPSAL